MADIGLGRIQHGKRFERLIEAREHASAQNPRFDALRRVDRRFEAVQFVQTTAEIRVRPLIVRRQQ